jgi:decaprenylphospho-beta-D-ribofuranose 2-oxidase
MRRKITNWGNFPVIEAEDRLFTFENELKKIHRQFSCYIPRGNGRCYGDASLAKQTITTTQYNKVLFFNNSSGIFECQSGITLDQILEIIVPKGWFLPVTPGTKFITVGGAVASDIHGKNHHIDGSFSSHVQELDVLIPSGEIINCGKEKNADLFEATCGGMGLTGLITRVVFTLKKIETSFIAQKQIKASNLEEMLMLFERYKDYTYSVAWIDCLQTGKNFGRGILMLGEHARQNELPANYKFFPLTLPSKRQIKLPFYLPSFVLNKITVKLFNTFFYHKNFKKEINNLIFYEQFFYPLDGILDWNKGYSRKGFIQYQFVLPLESKEGLINILKTISKKGLGSFLAVLKIFGKQDSLISFPMEGYTLALDIPVSKNLFPILDELDELVLSSGGRLYMSKDARMKASILKNGYPRLNEFIKIIHKYDPGNKLHSLLSDRLLLTTELI